VNARDYRRIIATHPHRAAILAGLERRGWLDPITELPTEAGLRYVRGWVSRPFRA
jgi:lambda repressor-like predicted transcriptional regulator